MVTPTSSAPAPRPGIEKLAPYRPEVSALPAGQPIIRLAVNEGALGPSPAAMRALADFPAGAHRYPEQISRALTEAIAETHGLNADMILPASGSDELFTLLATAYLAPGDEAIYTEYGFRVFPDATRIAGGVPVMAKDGADYTVSVDSILAALTPGTKIIFLANPNNPTGTMLARDEVARLVESTPPRVVIVLDSAYAEYVADPEYDAGAGFVETRANVVMTRTFSKIYGLGGLRLGWGYLPRGILDVLTAIRSPFSVNAAAAAAGIAAVRDRDFIARSIAHNEEWRPRLMESIRQAGFPTLPSVANFFLIRFADAADAEKAGKFLAARGILLRGMQPYGLGDCLRISVGTAEEMQITAAAFKDLAAELLPGGKGGS